MFGVREVPTTPPAERQRQAVAEESRLEAGTVMDHALRILIGADGLSERILVLVGDGRDGYLGGVEEVRDFHARKCGTEHGKREAAVRQCVGEGMLSYIGAEQERFADKAVRWLALARAAGVRIHAVGLRVDRTQERDFELDRLAVLARASGGTYREAADADSIAQKLDELSRELNGQLVAEVPVKARPGQALKIRVSASAAGVPTAISAPRTLEMPRLDGPLRRHAKARLAQIDELIGYPWGRVVLGVAVALVLLMVVTLGWKIAKGLGGLLKKAVKRGGEAAA
jgi:hypothetical protein